MPWCVCMHAVEAFMCREGPLIGHEIWGGDLFGF